MNCTRFCQGSDDAIFSLLHQLAVPEVVTRQVIRFSIRAAASECPRGQDGAQVAVGDQAFGEGVANTAAERVDHVFLGMAIGGVSSSFVMVETSARRLARTSHRKGRQEREENQDPTIERSVQLDGPR